MRSTVCVFFSNVALLGSTNEGAIAACDASSYRHRSSKTCRQFYITGHSLGGALGTMAAAALVDNYIAVGGVYTFGQPRVGDRAFVTQLSASTDGKIFRFVNNNDIVPHLPPPFSIWSPLRPYSHLGMIKYFNTKGLMAVNYKLAARLGDSAVGLVRRWRWTRKPRITLPKCSKSGTDEAIAAKKTGENLRPFD